MIIRTTLLFLFSLLSLCGYAQTTKTVRISVTNSSSNNKVDYPIVLNLKDLNLGFVPKSAVVMSGNTEIPSQLDDLTADRKADELAFVADISSRGKRNFDITFSTQKKEQEYPSRVYAEMLVSDKKGKHVPVRSVTIPGTSNIYNQMHHHGPAFESELVAYRLYFDQKQTVDIYGKFNKGFEIEESQFYPTDEQLARGFGDDVLRVSGSCGVGGFKGWNGSKAIHIDPVQERTMRILAYGPVRSIVELEVNGWNYQDKEIDLTTRYTLYAGHRDVQAEVFFSEPLQDEVFATGIQDVKGSVSYSDRNGLVGCWGTDWPVNDTVKYAKETVGLATYVPQKYVVKEAKDNPNYLYLVSPKGGNYIKYYTTFTSKKEKLGYGTSEAWFKHIAAWRKDIETPCVVEVVKSNNK